jgi:hypothetical protein
VGASGWDYVASYRGSVEGTLEALKGEVFEELYGDGEEYGSLEELYADEEFMEEEGTHSILDVPYGKLRPLAPERLVRYFGTGRPGVRQFKEAYEKALEQPQRGPEDALLKEIPERWSGVYVLLYAEGAGRAGDAPAQVGFFGISGD